MKTGWLLGWAVPETWFADLARRVFPEDGHTFITPGPEALAQLEAAGPFDRVAGYSLGSHLLLASAERVSALAGEVALLAPIFAFPREEKLGGRIARSQVRFLARWLRTDPNPALTDFYGQSGLDAIPGDLLAGLPLPDLLWGLERLATGRVEPPAPDGWRLFAGDKDTLLDLPTLRSAVPAVRVVPGASHHPEALMRAWKEETR